MIGTWIAILSVIVVVGRRADGLRTAQVESILTRLPAEEAGAYYRQLKRRLRKVAALRAVAFVCLVVLLGALRQLLARRVG